MKLPSHVLTKLYLAGAVGTVGAVVMCEPEDRIQCQPIVNIVEEDPTPHYETPLYEVVRNDPMPIVTPPRPRPPQPQVKPRARPPQLHASSCGPCGQG